MRYCEIKSRMHITGRREITLASVQDFIDMLRISIYTPEKYCHRLKFSLWNIFFDNISRRNELFLIYIHKLQIAEYQYTQD